MNEYDLFLLPTKWEGEGSCGAIIESKFAGIPAVVSDWHYNSELVSEGEGIVVKEYSGCAFSDVIILIVEGNISYEKMAEKAFLSCSKFDFTHYKKVLLNDVTIG